MSYCFRTRDQSEHTCQDANSVFVLCKEETDRTSRSKNKREKGGGSSLFRAGKLHLTL